MAIDAIVRVSFESDTGAGNRVRAALTGTIKKSKKFSPFKRVNTGVYSCFNFDDQEVLDALRKFAEVLAKEKDKIDFVSVTLTRHERKGTHGKAPVGKE